MRGERLFVAVPLDYAARRQLAQALPPELPGRLVVPDKWHFTLRFLGLTAPYVRDRLIAELERVPFGETVEAALGGFGAFPNASRARVLWVGVTSGADRLTQLAVAVAAACDRVGLVSDERPYSPHLTLSRLDPPRDVRRTLDGGNAIAVKTLLTEVVLMRSSLGHGSPRYEPLARFPLGSGK